MIDLKQKGICFSQAVTTQLISWVGAFMLMLTLLLNTTLSAQVSGYSFTQLISGYTPLSGTPTVAIAAPWDSQTNPLVPIGFTFNYDGLAYTDCRINPNGYITFGTTASAGNNVVPISSTTAYAGAVSAFGSDLVSNATDGIVYQTNGTAPNRVFTVQWTNAQRATDFVGTFSFQIRLFETTNVIEFSYGLCTTPNATLRTVQVGLRGPTNNFIQGNVNNRLQATSLEWFNNTTPGTANSSAVRSNNAAYPDLGLLYRFSPPPPCVTPAAQPTALVIGSTSINSTSFTGNSFTAAAPAPTNYLVLRSTVNTPPTAADFPNRTFPGAVNSVVGGIYTIVSTTAATTFTQTGLIPETTYYYWVIPYNINCLGAPFYNFTNVLTASATTCTPPTTAAPASAIGGNEFTANWSAVATASNYRIDVATDAAFTAILPAYNNLAVGNVTSFTVTGLLPLTTYYYRVRAIGISCALNSNTTTVSTLCGFYNIPYVQNFDATTVPVGGIAPCFTRNNVNNDAFQWGVQTITFASSPKSMLLSTVATIAADDWFFLPGLNLTGGTAYRLFFRYRTNSNGSQAEILKTYLGSGADPTLMNQTLIDLTNINNTLFRTAFVDFTPLLSGIYYIGFEGTSMALQSYIAVDDISVTLAPTCLDPTEVTITAEGTTTASISWVPPLPEPANGYQYFLSTAATPPTGATVPTGSIPFGSTTFTLTGLTPSTTYYIWLRGNCSATDKSVWTVEQTFSTECVTPTVTSTTGATRCGPGTLTLTAAGTTGSTIQWYGQENGGSIIATGNSYTTPLLNTTTTYYAEAKSLGATARCGPVSPTLMGGVIGVQNYQASVNFTVLSPTRLLTIDVFPVASGQPATIQVRNSSNLNLQTISFTTVGSGGTTAQVIPINYTFEPGTYNLFLSSSPSAGLAINTTNAFYPYSTSVAEITGNIVSNSQFLAFYNWKFTTECLSPRLPVTAIVNTPPSLTLSANAETICSGFSTPLITVSGAGSYNTLTWSPNTGVSGSVAAGFTFNPTTTTTYTLSAAQTSGSFCTNQATFTVTVNPSPPVVTIIPTTPPTLCQGNVQALNGSLGAMVTVQIYNQNFNGTTNDWTVANTSTDGSVANSQWTLRNSTYTYSSSTWIVSLRSNDNSRFYFANADSQGSSLIPFAVTRTTLTSPDFNLIGYTSANLNFWHYLRFILGDSFGVEVSTDNGATWTSVRQFTGTQGTPLNFANANIDLSAYAGMPSVRVRFNFISDWGYGWAIDNVTLTGSIASALQWSPANSLYTDAAATVPYVDGAFASVVYAKPTTSTVYTATAVNANGCSSSGSITLNVDAAPVGGTLSASQVLCSGIVPSNITLSGHSGSILRWQYADDAGFTSNVTNITNTTTTLTPAQMGVISSVRYFRAVVSNGVCTPVYSTVSSVSFPATTWNGSSWSNGLPNSNVKAIIEGNLTISADFYACALQVNSGVVTVNSGSTMIIDNEVSIAASASVIFENTASLKQINNTTNTGSITYKRDTTPVRKFDYTYWSSPVAGQTITALSPSTNPGTSYVWNTAINNWSGVSGATVMTAAKGYIIRAPDIAPFNTVTPNIYNATLFGVPHNGEVSTPIVVAGASKLNLIGNPYPSALNIDNFFLDPVNVPLVDATIYLWTHNTPITNNVYTSNDYAVYNLLGGVGTSTAVNVGVNNSLPNGKVAAGQSFFINGITNGNAIFKNSMREIGLNSQFFRLSESTTNHDKNRLWLELTNSQGAFKQVLIGYIEGATNGIDRGFDGAFVDAGNVVGFYSLAGDKLSIQGRPLPFDIYDEVPLGFKTNIAGSFEVSLAKFDGLFNIQDVILEDKLLNYSHNLKDGPYSFVTDTGTYDDRFVLRYTTGQLGTNDFDASQIIVYKNEQHWVINAGMELIKELKVFDTRGRLLLEQYHVNASETQIMLDGANQVLLIAITTVNGETVFKKIIN